IVSVILSSGRYRDAESIDAISRCATRGDAPILVRMLRQLGMSEETKPIVLALLSIGRPQDVLLILHLIVRSSRRIDYREQYDVVFAMAKAAQGKLLRARLLDLIR